MLLPGLGAVATTFIAGVDMVRRGAAAPIGSLTQLGQLRIGKRTDGESALIRDLLPLCSLDNLTFGAWDIVSEDAAQVAQRSGVLSPEHLEQSQSLLSVIKPKPGVHDAQRVRRIDADHVIQAKHQRERVEILRRDIADFKRDLGATRAVMILTASTETFRPMCDFGQTRAAFERALDENSPDVTPSMLYAYAAMREGVPVGNATPNLCVDMPALQEVALDEGVPVAGKDLKSGQTFMKTVIAPALKARMLGLSGWFSTNILGNRDGEVLDDPEAFRSKEITKTGVLDTILQSHAYPQLYGRYCNKVAIHYYPPRGDAKEGWDNIDIFGWLNYPMQIKVNFLCRDSILAAPLVLDLALFLDLAHRTGWRGIQEWLSFYFKCPMAKVPLAAEHDLFIQQTKLKNTLRVLAGKQPLTHLGLDYYPDELPLSPL